MASKTSMTQAIKRLDWREAKAALAASPGLLEVRDAKGRGWLHLCCGVDPEQRGLKPSAAVKTADVLLEAGLDIDREAFREGSWKATPLWYAVARGRNRSLVRHLLRRGADPEHCLWAAAYLDDVATIKLLIGAGARVDPVTEGHTPFLAAVQWSHFRAAEALLGAGADADFRDAKGMTALHYMLKKGSEARHFRTLLRHGARADIPDGQGRTAAEILGRKRSPGFRDLARRLPAPR